MPRVVLLFSILRISHSRFLRGAESIEDRRELRVVALCCFHKHYIICSTLDPVYALRDTHGHSDGEPAVRRPGSSTRALTTSTNPRNNVYAENFLSFVLSE